MNFYHLLEKSKDYLELAKQYKLSAEEKITASIELAAFIVQMSQMIESSQDKQKNKERHKIIQDQETRQFLTQLTDRIYRTHNTKRTAEHISDLLKKNGIPKGLSFIDQALLRGLPLFSKLHPNLLIHLCKQKVNKESTHFILLSDDIQRPKSLKEKKNKRSTP